MKLFQEFFQTPCYETRNQLQGKKNSENHKLMEAKQYDTKQLINH